MKINLPVSKLQAKFITCKARNICLIGGRRIGKSYAIATRIIMNCMNRPKMKIWYITPVHAQCNEFFQLFTDCLELQPYIKETIKSPYPKITFINGSTVGFRTFQNPKSLRGSGLHEVYVDEFQDLQSETDFWAVLKPLIAATRGNVITSGQFRGKDWRYEKLYLPGVPGPAKRKGYKSFRWPTRLGILFQSKAGKQELAEAKASFPKIIYDQEFECIPTANQAAVFRHEDLQAIKRGYTLERGIEGYQYVAGLDLGRVKDPSAMVVLEVSDTLPTIVFAKKRPLGEKHAIGAQHCLRISNDFMNCKVVTDTTGGATGGHTQPDEHVKFYREIVPSMVPFFWSPSNKTKIINNLMLAIEQHALNIPGELEDLHKELAAYEFKVKNSGKIEYGPMQNSGVNDDLVAALAQAWYGYQRGMYSITNSDESIQNLMRRI